MKIWRLEGPCVYRIFASDGTLIYIGSTGDLDQRMKLHLSSSALPDADLIRRYWLDDTAEPYATLAEARQAEREAIAAERPLLNREHNPSRWRRINRHDFAPTSGTLALIAALPEYDMAASMGRALEDVAS